MNLNAHLCQAPFLALCNTRKIFAAILSVALATTSFFFERTASAATTTTRLETQSKKATEQKEQKEKTIYVCPMHAEVRSDKPGECPKCGMKLVAQNPPVPLSDERTVYICPMHPEVKSDKPGECPKCGMKLEPAKKASDQHDHLKEQPKTQDDSLATTLAKSDAHAGHQMNASTLNKVTSQQNASNMPSITLAELEQMALKGNPTLVQADAAIRAAEGRKVQAGLLPNPIMGYNGTEFAFRSFSNKSEHSFFVEQEIPLGGKLKKSQLVFEQEKLQTIAQAEAQRRRVLNTVQMLYYQLLGAQALVEARTELAKITREAVNISEELLNLGQADQPDQIEIEIESQKEEIDLLEAENEAARVWQLLATVVGNPSMPRKLLVGDLEKGLPTFDKDTIVQSLLQQSPEMQTARVNLERARAKLTRAKAERTPDLILRGSLGYSSERLELGNAPFPRRTGPEASIEIGFRLPIFNRNQGGIAAAEAELASAEYEIQRVELSIRARLASALTAYETASRSTERYRDAILPRAQKAYQLYTASFSQMAAAYPQVLIAKRSFYRAQADYVKTLTTLWQNGIRIQGFLLTGGLDAPGMISEETKSASQSGNDEKE